MVGPLARLALPVMLLHLTACGSEEPVPGSPDALPRQEAWKVDFRDQPDVPPGKVPEWARKRGFTRILGNPVYFHLEKGRLHLVAKPGPVHDKRVMLAIFDRDRLRTGLESKVILRLSPEDLALDPADLPRVRFRMAPVTLPGGGADLRDSDRNDACFYLLIGFGEAVHAFSGVRLPDTLAYVWANRPWEKEVASDPDYREFLRYLAIGHGDERLAEIREITRNVAADYRRAFPGRHREKEQADGLPPIRSVAVMVDGNTLETRAESVLESVRFLPPEED